MSFVCINVKTIFKKELVIYCWYSLCISELGESVLLLVLNANVVSLAAKPMKNKRK